MDAKNLENFNDKNLTNDEKQYNKLWDAIVNNGIATENELNLISYIKGWRLETLEDVLYVRTGYRDLEQFIKECESEVDYE